MRSTKSRSWIEGALGLRPLPAPPHVFRLDSRALAYGNLQIDDGGAVEVRELRNRTLPEGVAPSGRLGGPIRSPARLVEEIDGLLDGLSGPVESASLVLPDDWVRITFVEVEDLPRSDRAREEVVRWKLKPVLPVRPDDLRLDLRPTPRVVGESESTRLLVGFALEALLGPLEEAFASRGIRLGRISGESLALLPALQERVGGSELAGIALVGARGYTLLFVHRGEPVLTRSKHLDVGLEGADDESIIRDLRLTRAFLRERIPSIELSEILVVAPPTAAERWRRNLEAGFGSPSTVLEPRDFGLRGDGPVPWPETAPMVGAVRWEIT